MPGIVVSICLLEIIIEDIIALLYSISFWLTVYAVSLTQHAIANAITKSSLYDLIACALLLCQMKVLNSPIIREEYTVISWLRMNSSILAIIRGRVLEEVVNPGTELFVPCACASVIYSCVPLTEK